MTISAAELTEGSMEDLLDLAHNVVAEMQRRTRPKPENIHLIASIRVAINALGTIETAHRNVMMAEQTQTAAPQVKRVIGEWDDNAAETARRYGPRDE